MHIIIDRQGLMLRRCTIGNWDCSFPPTRFLHVRKHVLSNIYLKKRITKAC